MKAGKTVLVPFGDNKRYDLVIDEGYKFVRVQVKTAWLDNGCLVFNTCSLNPFTSVRKSYEGEADLFMIYSPDLDKVYAVNVEDSPVGSMRLRVETPKKQQNNIRWASNYEYTGS